MDRLYLGGRHSAPSPIQSIARHDAAPPTASRGTWLAWEVASENSKVVDRDLRAELSVEGMEVRREVIPEIQLDIDPIEARDDGHGSIISKGYDKSRSGRGFVSDCVQRLGRPRTRNVLLQYQRFDSDGSAPLPPASSMQVSRRPHSVQETLLDVGSRTCAHVCPNPTLPVVIDDKEFLSFSITHEIAQSFSFSHPKGIFNAFRSSASSRALRCA